MFRMLGVPLPLLLCFRLEETKKGWWGDRNGKSFMLDHKGGKSASWLTTCAGSQQELMMLLVHWWIFGLKGTRNDRLYNRPSVPEALRAVCFLLEAAKDHLTSKAGFWCPSSLPLLSKGVQGNSQNEDLSSCKGHFFFPLTPFWNGEKDG